MWVVSTELLGRRFFIRVAPNGWWLAVEEVEKARVFPSKQEADEAALAARLRDGANWRPLLIDANAIARPGSDPGNEARRTP
jgi:hypothetical protein